MLRFQLLGLVLFQLMLLANPAFAFQVQLEQKNTPFRTEPDLRKGKDQGRLSPQKLTFLKHVYVEGGELWCFLRAKNGREGWIQSRFLNPILKRNIPITIADFPSALIFEKAHKKLVFHPDLSGSDFKSRLQRSLYEMELAQIKQRWESLHNRLNFLDISRRVGVSVSEQEFISLKQELRVLEQRFQFKLSEWQRVS